MGWVPGSRDQEQQGQWRLCLADGTGRGDCTWTCQRRGVGGWGEVRPGRGDCAWTGEWWGVEGGGEARMWSCQLSRRT